MFGPRSRPALSALLVASAFTMAVVIAPDSASAAQPSPSATDSAAPQAATDPKAGAGSGEALDDAQKIAVGEGLWQKQCRHCHGRSAYPGKAPKLKPRKYKPEFVYDRVTNGFRKMPPWKAVFSDEERWSIVAYIMSRQFSP